MIQTVNTVYTLTLICVLYRVRAVLESINPQGTCIYLPHPQTSIWTLPPCINVHNKILLLT